MSRFFSLMLCTLLVTAAVNAAALPGNIDNWKVATRFRNSAFTAALFHASAPQFLSDNATGRLGGITFGHQGKSVNGHFNRDNQRQGTYYFEGHPGAALRCQYTAENFLFFQCRTSAETNFRFNIAMLTAVLSQGQIRANGQPIDLAQPKEIPALKQLVLFAGDAKREVTFLFGDLKPQLRINDGAYGLSLRFPAANAPAAATFVIIPGAANQQLLDAAAGYLPTITLPTLANPTQAKDAPVATAPAPKVTTSAPAAPSLKLGKKLPGSIDRWKVATRFCGTALTLVVGHNGGISLEQPKPAKLRLGGMVVNKDGKPMTAIMEETSPQHFTLKYQEDAATSLTFSHTPEKYVEMDFKSAGEATLAFSLIRDALSTGKILVNGKPVSVDTPAKIANVTEVVLFAGDAQRQMALIIPAEAGAQLAITAVKYGFTLTLKRNCRMLVIPGMI